MERAARCAEQPPRWVQMLMSSAGWRHYSHLREEAGHPDQAIMVNQKPTPGGVAGCSMDTIQELEVIRNDGQAHEWAALVIDGEEIGPAGRPNWLGFVWFSQWSDQQHRVYEWTRG